MISERELDYLKKKAAENPIINDEKTPIDFNHIANTFPSIIEINEMEPPLCKETYLLSLIIRSSIPYLASLASTNSKPYLIATLFYQMGYMQAMKQLDKRREEEVKYGPNS